MPKNAQTTTQLHSSHMLVKKCSKFSKPGFRETWTVNWQMFKLDLEKAEEQRSNCQHLRRRQCHAPSSTLAWKIPWTQEPGGPQSMGSLRVGHNWVTSLSLFTFIKRLFSSSSLSAIRVVSSAYLRFLIFLQQSWFQLVFLPVQHFSWCALHIS